MPRTRQETSETNTQGSDAIAETGASAARTSGTEPTEPKTSAESSAAPAAGGASEDGQSPETRNWGPPYKAIFVSPEKGFEMGENRRFRQRVFLFKDKPSPEILAALKENGFVYRAAEKAWTIPADAPSRAISDDLARQFAGQTKGMSR